MIIDADLELDAKAVLGEGPCWDRRTSILYWVDIEEGLLHAYDPSRHADRTVPVHQPIGAVVTRASGGLILALRDGFFAFDPSSASLEAIVDPEAHLPTTRFNDGKCDPSGRLWAGTTGLPRGCALYRLDLDLSAHRMVSGVSISNGLAWSPDERIMYYVDSPTRAIVAFDYERGSGQIARRRQAFRIPEGMGLPDGMTIDEEGMLWVALWDGGLVGRWDPQTGDLVGRVRLPVSRPTSCAFGGEHLDELYITSARVGLDEASLAEQPLAGGIFKCRPGVRGGPSWDFRG